MHLRVLTIAAIILLALLCACSPAPTLQPTVAATAQPSATPTAAPSPTPTEVALYCPSANAEALTAYNDARQAAAAGDLAAAETLFTSAIELDPAFCDAMDNLAGLLRSQDRLDEAADWLTKSLAVHPENASSLAALGRIYTMLGQPDKAIDPYLKLTSLEPANPVGYYGLGMAYYISGDYELASLSLVQAEKLLADQNSPYLTDTRYLLGMSLFYLQQLDNALPYLTSVYDQLKDDGGLNYALGLCYLYGTAKDMTLAKQYIDQAEQLGIEIPDATRQDLESAGG
ncbi:MAG: tetratricopeptide repeat protein [Chloroflexi bacterium]|nr:tetratricopeptide repeat protein [Chloroflexota bacterium]